MKVLVAPKTESNSEKWQITETNQLRDRETNQLLGKIADSEAYTLAQLRSQSGNHTLNIRAKLEPPIQEQSLSPKKTQELQA